MSKRLIGSDGKLMAGGFGTPVVATETLDADTWYRIVQIDATSSIFPDNIEVGLLYYAKGTEVLATDDIAEPWEGEDFCDVANWSLEFTKDEIETTVFCSEVKEYRAGKTDVTGSVDGIFTTEITDGEDGFMTRFVKIVFQDDGATPPDDYKVQPVNDSTLYAMLWADKTDTTGEWQAFYFMPIELTGFSASAGGEDAQTFTSPFRVAPSDQGVVFYEYKVQ